MKTLVIACAALTRELRLVLEPFGDDIQVHYLPSPLHNRPERICPAIEEVLEDQPEVQRVVLVYADCGTGGHIDQLIERWTTPTRTVTRLPGAHCYEFFSGTEVFAQMHEADPGTFYLTDYLARHFDALVVQGLGIDRHPELRDMYFGNYNRLMLLRQSDDDAVIDAARAAAELLGLRFELHDTGLDCLRVAFNSAIQHTANE